MMKLKQSLFVGMIVLVLLVVACSREAGTNKPTNSSSISNETESVNITPAFNSGDILTDSTYEVDEQEGTVYYEIFVRAFYDSDGDGIGDLNGVTEKLDYLKELGMGGIWLMPINPSPSYHGYDTTDYYDINPEYGTLEDFKTLLDEAHKRDIKVIMDLVVNHSSTEHPWFIDAKSNPNSPYRNWYHFANIDEPTKNDSAASSGTAWHTTGNSKYLGIFWSGMPDLNFDEPLVREEFIKIGQFWLEQGVDGFRLDAAKHIFGDYNSTVHDPEVQQKNHEFWQQFRNGMDIINSEAFLIGEVWDSMSVIGPYFNEALDSAFNFDLGKQLISAVKSETDPDLAYSLGRMHQYYNSQSNGDYVDAPFLTNHDQPRVMTELGENINHAKMAASLLLTLPGTPFIYYGEEIGMVGTKPDEYIREPMLWYANDEGGPGQTTWIKTRHHQQLADRISVEAQHGDQQSLLEHYRKLMHWRNSELTLQNGAIAEYEEIEKTKHVSAYVRVTEGDRTLVIHNLSGEAQNIVIGASERYGSFTDVLYTTDDLYDWNNGQLSLPAYSTIIVK